MVIEIPHIFQCCKQCHVNASGGVDVWMQFSCFLGLCQQPGLLPWPHPFSLLFSSAPIALAMAGGPAASFRPCITATWPQRGNSPRVRRRLEPAHLRVTLQEGYSSLSISEGSPRSLLRIDHFTDSGLIHKFPPCLRVTSLVQLCGVYVYLCVYSEAVSQGWMHFYLWPLPPPVTCFFRTLGSFKYVTDCLEGAGGAQLFIGLVPWRPSGCNSWYYHIPPRLEIGFSCSQRISRFCRKVG